MISSFEIARRVIPRRRDFLHDHGFDVRVTLRRTRTGWILVPASAHLAAEAAALAENIGEPGIAHVRWPALELALAHEVRHIMPRHFEHSAGPHGETECGQRAIDVLRQRAFLHQAIGLPQIGIEHPVGAEAIADAYDDTDLADRTRKRHRGRKHRGIGLGAANDLKKPHDMGRTKEM